MSTTTTHLNKSNLIKWAVTFALTLSVLLIPLSEAYTQPMRIFIMISVFGLMMAAFEFFPILIPALFLPTAYFVSGVAPIGVAFSGWTTSVTWIVLGAFFLATAFDDIGLLRRIAFFVILKSGGTYNRTVLGMVLAGTVLTLITFGNAYVIMIALAYGVTKSLNLGKSTDAAIIMFGACLGAVTTRGVVYTPSSLSLMNAGAQTIIPDFYLAWYDMMLHCSPLFLLVAILYFVLIKMRKNKTEINSKEYIQAQYEALGPMSMKEKKGLFVLSLLLLYLVTAPLHKLSMDYAFMIIPWFLCLPGIDVAGEKSLKNIDFSMVFFVVGCLGIGTVAAYLGVGKLFSTVLSPILSPLGPVVALAIVYLLGAVLNLFMTPLAFLAGFSGPITQIALDINLNPAAALYVLNFASDAIFLPYEYIPYLIAYSFGVIPMVDFIKYSLIKFVIYLVFIMVVILPFWKLIGLM